MFKLYNQNWLFKCSFVFLYFLNKCKDFLHATPMVSFLPYMYKLQCANMNPRANLWAYWKKSHMNFIGPDRSYILQEYVAHSVCVSLAFFKNLMLSLYLWKMQDPASIYVFFPFCIWIYLRMSTLIKVSVFHRHRRYWNHQETDKYLKN